MQTPACFVSRRQIARSVRALLALLWVMLTALPAGASLFGSREWPEVMTEEQALTGPLLQTGAVAELLRREIVVDDRDAKDTTYEFFHRVKLYDARAVEDFKVVELEGGTHLELSRVEARVIHPDGRITELERDAVYTQDDFRLGHERRERVTFALPNLEPGCIVDYRWRAVHKGKAHGLRFYTQARYPTHELFIRFAFYPHLRAAWTTSGFPSSWLEERNGGHELRMRQLAAAPDEEFLPTPDEIVPWITTYYLFQRGDDWVREFWTDFAKVLAREEKAFQTRHRAIRRQAEELTAGAAGEEEALRRLFAYCQGEILNLEDEANGLSTREIEQYAELKKATDVLKNGYGDASLINALFGSLAGALGYEVRWAAATDRSEGAFSSKRAYYYALPDRLVALRREGEHAWRFFDPGTPEAAFTHLAWWNEDTRALLGNRDGPYF
ncbi:MAG: DUF3857 domain-containing protein, partial [Opitutales bacterium]